MDTQVVRVIVTIGNHSAAYNVSVAFEADTEGAYAYLINDSCGMFGKRAGPVVWSQKSLGYECRF